MSKPQLSKAEKQAKMAKIPSAKTGVPTPAEQAAAAKKSTVVANIPEDTTTEKAAGKVKKEKEVVIKSPGKIAQILELFKAGKTNKEIVEAGFHGTTVAIQVSKYKKAHPDLYPVVPKVKKEKAAKAVKETETVEA